MSGRMTAQARLLRDEYLAIEGEQERADFLWTRRLSGSELGLAPSQYPKAHPQHKPCTACGGAGEARIDQGNDPMRSCRIVCTRCGRQTAPAWSTMFCWREWDDGNLEGLGQMSIFDMMQ